MDGPPPTYSEGEAFRPVRVIASPPADPARQRHTTLNLMAAFSEQHDAYLVRMQDPSSSTDPAGVTVLLLGHEISPRTLNVVKLVEDFRDVTEASKARGYEVVLSDAGLQQLCLEAIRKEGDLGAVADMLVESIVKFDVYTKPGMVVYQRSGDLGPAFSWSKPHSVYRTKSGPWQLSLHQAFEDASWKAGSDVLIVMDLLDSQAFEKLRGSRPH